MNLVPCEIPNRAYKKTKLLRVLEEFMAMEVACARVDGTTHSSATIATRSLNAAIKRFRMNTVRAIERNGAVYLIRDDMIKEVSCK